MNRRTRRPVPAETRGQFSGVYQFRVTLQEVNPPIWRRIQVPGNYTFWDLHVAIQDAMGWLDYHLHEFAVLNPKTGKPEHIGIPNEDGFEDDIQWLPGWKIQISDYLSSENPDAVYNYDFGDDWKHDVVLEQVVPRDTEASYPRCMAGERACPPEDCGGIFGYEEFLHAILDPQHDEHDSMLEWVGGSFDPEDFDPGQVRFDDPGVRWRTAFERG